MLTLHHVTSLFEKRKRCKPVCLFGPPDPLETEKSYEEAFMENRDKFLKRWNFDVYTMEPSTQPGGLKWEATRCEQPNLEETSGEARLTAGNEEATTTSPEGRIQDTYAEVITSSLTGSRTGSAVRYSPYHKQQKLTDLWRSKKSSRKALLKSRQSSQSEDNMGHTHTLSHRENSNVNVTI